MQDFTPIDYPDLADQVYRYGGFTYDVTYGAQPIAGYVVATRPDAERTVQLFAPGNAHLQVQTELYTYIVEHGHDLRSGYQLGAWLQGNTLTLDLVRVIADRDAAVITGALNGQDAIYDLNTQTTIYLPTEEA